MISLGVGTLVKLIIAFETFDYTYEPVIFERKFLAFKKRIMKNIKNHCEKRANARYI